MATTQTRNVIVYAVLVQDTVEALWSEEFATHFAWRIAPSERESVEMEFKQHLLQAYTRGLDDGYTQGVERATEADEAAYREKQERDVETELEGHHFPVGCGMGGTQRVLVSDVWTQAQRWFCVDNMNVVSFVPCDHIQQFWRSQGTMRNLQTAGKDHGDLPD